MKVFIALGHPDMTYYGDADIFAVTDARELAEAAVAALEDKYDRANATIEEQEVTTGREVTEVEVDPTGLLPGDVVLGLSEHELAGCHCDVRVRVLREKEKGQ